MKALVLIAALAATPAGADGIGYSECVNQLERFQLLYGEPNSNFSWLATIFGPGPVADAARKMQRDHNANAKVVIAAIIAACKAAN